MSPEASFWNRDHVLLLICQSELPAELYADGRPYGHLTKARLSDCLTGRQEEYGTIIQLSAAGKTDWDDNTMVHLIKSKKPSTVRHTGNLGASKKEKQLSTRECDTMLSRLIIFLFYSY